MDNKFIIPLNGLAAGESRFSWHAGKEFFEEFGNTELLAADIDIEVVAEKSGRYLGIDCEVDGKVTVECDRCLEDLDIMIGIDIMLSVKYGSEENPDDHQEGEREVLFVPQDEAELDLSQIIYDYVCLSLPMQRVHEDGGCNPETMRYYAAGEVEALEEPEQQGNPFAALKDMFK